MRPYQDFNTLKICHSVSHVLIERERERELVNDMFSH